MSALGVPCAFHQQKSIGCSKTAMSRPRKTDAVTVRDIREARLALKNLSRTASGDVYNSGQVAEYTRRLARLLDRITPPEAGLRTDYWMFVERTARSVERNPRIAFWMKGGTSERGQR